MLKASALYMVIIIALVIAVFSASLIATAYFYRLEYQKNMRFGRLQLNLNSAASILLSSAYVSTEEQRLDLFGEQTDSVVLKKDRWGLFAFGTAKAFTLNDTLKKAFLIAEDTEKDQTAVYLSDEDRPLSVSGNTRITGDVQIPKAGIKQAYVEGKPYAGKELVYGSIKNSTRTLPQLNQSMLDEIEKYLGDTLNNEVYVSDSLSNSFFNEPKVIRVSRSSPAITNTAITGRVIILCDTVLTIGPGAQLRDVLVYAPSIVVKEGFKGSGQLFARDSVVVEKKADFEYPSAIGILKKGEGGQPKIELGSDCRLAGIIFTHEKKRSELQTVISLGKNAVVKGEIYAAGFIKMEKPVTVEGKVSCNRFIIQTPSTLYENYLIDITINRNSRSAYYLSSPLFEHKAPNQILRWLN
ncbi:hypothetical protein BDE36_2601 [Arcticibacter tournemirensis]|uniref:Uncharacterized protein n=1 Tax=Arcticibacter tournemirensis TaxID=699437 RepID=A0A5M9GQX7_9SPHI|nr:hypothetical protein [Arcticibacter tournemirensis]KAA8476141.1 hypothetical protein F1649_20345 [Arcticibacter tournemirensis]TQM50837.1 hypothetical protein BDE36_2601 [Arcticibacter tournemirensis]